METLLIPITEKSHNKLSQEVLNIHARQWFQENGTLPFEHGFKAQTFNYKGNTYQPYMCAENGVSVRNVKNRNSGTISWFLLPKRTILKIIKECNRYYEYVMKNV